MASTSSDALGSESNGSNCDTLRFSPVEVSAPSKIILHGEHAVVYGKTAVAASIGLRTRMTLTPLGQSQDNHPLIRLHFPDVKLEDSWSQGQVSKLLAGRPKPFKEEGSSSSGSGAAAASGTNRKRKSSETCLTLDEKGREVLNGICWFSTDRVETDFLLEICNFLGVDKADLRMSSLICFFYLYALLSHDRKELMFPPLDISIQSEIPIGVGLGSSAALSVCLAAGLLAIRDQIFVGGANPPGLSDKRLAEICQLARVSEQILHGRCSGIDNSVSTYGGLVKFANFARVEGGPSKAVKGLGKAAKLRILLVGTKVPRNTKHLVEHVRKGIKEFPGINQPVIDAIDAVSRDCLDTLERLAQSADEFGSADSQSADDSNSSSSQSADESRSNSQSEEDKELYERLETLIDYNQKLLETLGVSHPALEKVCQTARAYGLHAKLTGAGGGGYAFVLVPPHACPKAVTATIESLHRQSYDCWETELGVEGVTVSRTK